MHPYFKTANNTWRNAIRHNLSVNECFIRCGRASSGRGYNWYIHPGCVEMFRRGDFRRRELRRKVNEILQFSKMSKTYNPALTPIHQNSMTPINQAAITLAGTTTAVTPVSQTSMVPVNQTTMVLVNQTPIVPANQTAMVPVNQTAMVPANQTAMVPVNQTATVPVNQNAMVPVSHIQPHGYQAQYSTPSDYQQYSQHQVSMATDAEYYPCSTPQYWTSTPKHYKYSNTSYS